MPTDLLLAAFALILLANAVLVAVSLKAMRRSRDDAAPSAALEPRAAPPVGERDGAPDGALHRPGASRPIARNAMSAEIERAVRARRTILGEPSAAPAGAGRAERVDAAIDGRRPAVAPPAARASESDHPKPRRAPASPARGPRPDATPSAASGPLPTDASRPKDGTTPRRGRRKFSLPPLDDDHEKVSRSIESFLTGGDAAGPGPDQAAAPAPRASAGDSAPTTVALVAVCGPAGDPSLSGAAGGAPSGQAAIAAARAVVERTLRGAARGTDTVEIDDAGRFRIVLASTGELAARAYLRRIRATVEPLLEASEEPLRLVSATATVLDEPLTVASAVAERRLAAVIARSDDRAASSDDDGEDEPEPRAAGD